MKPVLYDLATADKAVRPSPYCWIVKFALLHKNIEFDTHALSFQPKSAYPDPAYGKLPILKDGDKLICNSADIIKHLESEHPQNPLIGDAQSKQRYDRVLQWLDEQLFPALVPFMFMRVCNLLSKTDAAYFRETREAKVGMSLEAFAKTADPVKMTKAFEMISRELGEQEWFGGENPDLSDYTIASMLMWQHSVTQETLYDLPDAIGAWLSRVKLLFNGYAGKAKSAG